MVDASNALPDDDRRSDLPAPQETRPDWLVSSDQGAEDNRRAPEEGTHPEGLRLTTSKDLSSAVPVQRQKIPVRPSPEEARKAEKPRGPVAWSAAASSVPKLKVIETTPDERAAHAAGREAPARPEPVRPAAVPARAMESSRRAEVAPAYRDDCDDDGAQDEEFTAFPEATGPVGPVVAARAAKLEEPLWVVALDAVRSNQRVQWIALAAVLVPLLTWMLWPRSEPGISLHALKREPERWDGQVVRLNGRVGDVFHVGAGWAFNLHQGRDTIVVFTRGTAPRTRDKISIAGSISTGYLDGQARLAIFAEPESK